MKDLQLTGWGSNEQLVRLSLAGREIESDGLQADLAVFMTGLRFTISSFYFGYNLASFSTELELMELGERQTANLFNFDETLVISLSQTKDEPPIRYAFVSYGVPNPHPPSNVQLIPLDACVRAFAFTGGTHVSIAFLRIHERAGEVAKLIDQLVSENKIATANPHPSCE